MANNEHLKMLQQGVAMWDDWRRQNPAIRPDLSRADLSETDLSRANLIDANLSRADLRNANLFDADFIDADFIDADFIDADLGGADLRNADLRNADLSGANLEKADLSDADLSGANLIDADLSRADLSRANLRNADLRKANFSDADLSGADLSDADLRKANLRNADLRNADLSQATLVDTNLCDTNLTGCSIYGISAWDIRLEGAKQRDLIITPSDQPVITVDNLEVAQFIYLLLNNPKVRDVIDTIAKKAVLILGRFTPERKPVLEALRTALRAKRYLPILFDFDKPRSQDVTETVSTLAHLSCFVIADLTDPNCSPYEIGMIAPDHIKPIQPLFQPSAQESREFAMLKDLRQRYYWVLPTYQYHSLEDLITSLQDKVITPAEQKIDEIAMRRKTE